jgi:perosamine synthetase
VIPVFEPALDEDDLRAITSVFRRGEISGAFGNALPEFERAFSSYCGVKHGIAVSSGTAALQLAVAAAEIATGAEVLISSLTNIATALAVLHNAAETWNLDLDRLEALITPHTRAIIPVHLYGHPVDMDRLCGIAEKHRLIVIEDCAESHGATCRGRMTGSFGLMGCFSFYANKVITTGEGGMVVTNDDALAARMRLLRNLAFAEPRFYHEVAGFNFRMTGLQAALGASQTRKIESVIREKRRVAQTYNQCLSEVSWLQRPTEATWARNVYWMYAVSVRDGFSRNRDEIQRRLRIAGVDTRTFFCPMSQQPCVQRVPGYRHVECPVADGLWTTGFYLPSSPNLSSATLEMVAKTLIEAGGGV